MSNDSGEIQYFRDTRRKCKSVDPSGVDKFPIVMSMYDHYSINYSEIFGSKIGHTHAECIASKLNFGVT